MLGAVGPNIVFVYNWSEWHVVYQIVFEKNIQTCCLIWKIKKHM